MRPARAGDSAKDELHQAVSEARAHRRRIDAIEGQLHVPNHIPRQERIANVLLSLSLLAYALFGLAHDDLFIPSKRSSGLHLHGAPMWVMAGAMVSAVASLLSVVIDHYDTRPNERLYRRFALGTQALGWALFLGAFALDAWVYKIGTR